MGDCVQSPLTQILQPIHSRISSIRPSSIFFGKNGSAIEGRAAPIVRSRFTTLANLDPHAINSLFEDMEKEAISTVRLGSEEGALCVRRHAYIRYAGQGHEIKVELPHWPLKKQDRDSIQNAFMHAYESQYGRGIPGVPLEILTWSLTASTEPDEHIRSDVGISTDAKLTSDKRSEVRMPDRVKSENCPVIERHAIPLNTDVKGPAIITENQTTLILPQGWTLRANQFGDLRSTEISGCATKSSGPPQTLIGFQVSIERSARVTRSCWAIGPFTSMTRLAILAGILCFTAPKRLSGLWVTRFSRSVAEGSSKALQSKCGTRCKNFYHGRIRP